MTHDHRNNPIFNPEYVKKLGSEILVLKESDPEAYRKLTMDLFRILRSKPNR